MPTVMEILQEERNRKSGELILFLEGKFWKAYERSAFLMTKMHNFKPTKRFVKLIGEEIISVGFPLDSSQKYLQGAVLEANGKRCRVQVECPYDEQAFNEWKAST